MKNLLLIVSCCFINYGFCVAQNKIRSHVQGKALSQHQKELLEAERLKFKKFQDEIKSYSKRNKKTFNEINNLAISGKHPYLDTIEWLSYNMLSGAVYNAKGQLYKPKWILDLKEKEYNIAITELRKMELIKTKNLISNYAYQDSLATYSYRYFWDYNHVYKDKYFNVKYHRTRPYWLKMNNDYGVYLTKKKR
jgi:hypothetical protein